MLSKNLLKKYGTMMLVVVCLLFIAKEVLSFISPPCTNMDIHSLTDVRSVMIHVDKHAVESKLDYKIQKDLYNTSIFIKQRLKLWYGGRCIDKSDSLNKLVVTHCNPDKNQGFTLLGNGKLLLDRTNECVVSSNDDTLELVGCEDGGIFQYVENKFIQTLVDGEMKCLSPVSHTGSTEAYLYSCLNTPLSLTGCHETASWIDILEEKKFQRDRLAFARSQPSINDKSCDFKACGINQPAEPIKMLGKEYVSRCTNVFDCVTVLTKTARRPYLVMRFAQSIRDLKGYDLRIVCYDDGPNDYPDSVWKELEKYPYLEYIVGEDEDMGISRGRNLGLQRIKTKYFLLVDDDHVFNNKTNINKMIEILDTTDATLVGGKFKGFMKFAGSLRFGYYHSRQEFAVFSGHCQRYLTKFENCEQCETTSNIFLAKTEQIKEIGGWTDELKIAEHADFFVKLKGHKKKVVYCDDIEVINQQESKAERSLSYQKLRYDSGRKNRMFRLMNSIYNVNGLFWCSAYNVTKDGALQCLKTKHKLGYC